MSTASAQAADQWLRRYGPPGTGEFRLFCFPYAGGSAAMFRAWHETLPAAIEPIAVQPPGRDRRLAEAPYEDMTLLVTHLADVLAPVLDKPFACYGHSMGARVALELTHELRARGLPAPRALFVGSSVAPALRLAVRGWNEPDDRLVEYLRELGGTPDIVFADRDLLALFLPTVRADLTVIGRHVPPARPPLAVPLYAFAGAADAQATAELMRPWQAETASEFELVEVSGGHFFDADGTRQVLEQIPKLMGRP